MTTDMWIRIDINTPEIVTKYSLDIYNDAKSRMEFKVPILVLNAIPFYNGYYHPELGFITAAFSNSTDLTVVIPNSSIFETCNAFYFPIFCLETRLNYAQSMKKQVEFIIWHGPHKVVDQNSLLLTELEGTTTAKSELLKSTTNRSSTSGYHPVGGMLKVFSSDLAETLGGILKLCL